MIRTLLALDGTLVRGAMSLVLEAEDDIMVVAELDGGEPVGPVLWTQLPDVAVVDLDLVDDAVATATNPCPLLVLTDPRRAHGLGDLLSTGRTIGILGNNVPPQAVVDGVRRLSRGEPVVDADLVVAALEVDLPPLDGPLTVRETDVLMLTAAGSPVAEVAASLGLRPGTVRNHLTRITRKCGARTRVEAVQVARDAGWI
ncbi:response regulator transcription factor [Micromonospora tulbaghiae]|uniref:response regulator transcription factor n=1 Tax=Micromonospora tulbaghiae TaxID=479978 RepID=UPI0033CFB363